jgi:hypothetical protein
VAGVKHFLLMIAAVALVGCGKGALTKEESAKVIEAAVRKQLKKPTGELTKADYEKVTDLDLAGNQLTNVKGLEKLTHLERLWLDGNQLTDVKGLEKLTQLRGLRLDGNPDLTKAQIAELQKSLPKCDISSDLPLTKEESAKVIEAAIRKAAKKPTGELTKADYEKVTHLDLDENKLTSVKGLENLTQLKELYLNDNPDLTKAQVVQLQKALPKCVILSNTKK